MQNIEFKDEDGFDYLVSVPVLNQDKLNVLRMWVAYDMGKRYSYYDYSEVKRGYYLYFSLEEIHKDYLARSLSTHAENCRIFLGEVSRRSKGWHKDFAQLAEKIVLPAIQDLFPEMELDWENLSYCYWSGKGSGVGMFCDFYKILQPRETWL